MKYIMLYNLDDDLYSMQMVNKIQKAIPTAKILNFSLFQEGTEIDHDGKSIWIPEQYYMIALTIVNYEDLLDIGFYDWEPETTIDDLVEWFEMHKNNDNYIKYDL